MEEVNPHAGVAYDAPTQALPDIAATLASGEKEAPKQQEPLPEVPKGPLTVDQAYDFLGVKKEDRGNLDKVKLRFRKMSIKFHPDKNIGREEAATEVFKCVNAAYHTLTTNNFDYERWAKAFVIPPMQSLEDVLMMALKGADPYAVEALLRKRGDYRPHQDFGVNLSIPWNAGSKEEPSWDVGVGSAYHNTRALEDRRRAELGYAGGGGGGGDVGGHAIVQHRPEQADLLQRFGEKAQVGEDREARPWETVGGVGFGGGGAPAAPKPAYVKPKGRADLTPGSAAAVEAAEACNDEAVKAFKAKHWQLCYDHASEAIRLRPNHVAYLGNRAAAAIKMGKRKDFRQAAEDAVLCYELDPTHLKSYVRAAQAHLQLGERATVKLSIQEYEKAVEMAPDNKAYQARATASLRTTSPRRSPPLLPPPQEALRDARLTWEADFD